MWLASPGRCRPFTDYAILGDDVLIIDDKVAHEYRLADLNVSISDSQSIMWIVSTSRILTRLRSFTQENDENRIRETLEDTILERSTYARSFFGIWVHFAGMRPPSGDRSELA